MTTTSNLFSELEDLRARVFRQDELLGEKDERIAFLNQENERLKEMMVQLKKLTFGPRAERWESEEQARLFNEVEQEAAKGQNPEDTITVEGHTKKRGCRRPLPEHLPREIVVIELPEAERVDEAGLALKVIGKEVSEKLEYEPAKMRVIEYHRLRYGRGAGEPVKTAPAMPSVIPKGIATPSLLAAIVTAKYADGLPLYRQEEILRRQGVDLSRTSMSRWVVQAAEAARPIWNLLEERLMNSSYVQVDETHCQVLKEKGRAATSKSWMWVRTTPNDTEKIVLFDYDPHRSGAVVERLFADYKGTAQCDGYAAYNKLGENIDRIGCNMHGRRGFRKAADGSAKSKAAATVALKFYQRLYKIEEGALGKTWPERRRIRAERAAPIWAEFKAWGEETFPKVPRKSSVGEALHYFLGEYDRLVGYLEDGRYEIDNGHAERMIKNFAIGRKNWLFSDSAEGAEASAIFYSFIITAKINGQDPFQAMKAIFARLPLARTVDDYERLADLLTTTKH